MRTRSVVYGGRIDDDLHRIFLWLAETASPESALRVVERIEAQLSRLDIASERGALRDDLSPGLRIIALRERTVAAVRVSASEVLVVRVFYGGEDWEAALRGD